VTASGTDYTPERLAGQARGLVTRIEAASARTSTDGDDSEEAAEQDMAGTLVPDGAAVRGCVNALTKGSAQGPLAVDIATFRGRPAAVVVLRTPGDRSSLDVFVVDRRCSAAADRTLYFQRIAR